MSAVCYAEAAGCAFERLPPGFPKPASIRTRCQRWEKAGVLADILDAAAPAIQRIGSNYWARLSALSPSGDDWKFNREKDDKAFANLPRR